MNEELPIVSMAQSRRRIMELESQLATEKAARKKIDDNLNIEIQRLCKIVEHEKSRSEASERERDALSEKTKELTKTILDALEFICRLTITAMSMDSSHRPSPQEIIAMKRKLVLATAEPKTK